MPGSFPFKAIHMTEIVIKSDGRHQRNDLQHIDFRDKLLLYRTNIMVALLQQIADNAIAAVRSRALH